MYNHSMDSMNYDQLFSQIEDLVLRHSPSGAEQEIDGWLLERFTALGQTAWQDAAGNIIAKVTGKNPGAIAITAIRMKLAQS